MSHPTHSRADRPTGLRPAVVVLIGILVVSILLGLGLGSVSISVNELLSVLLGTSDNPIHQQILLHLRIPRILLALGVGATLAMCGAYLQGLFRNPLADPSLIGVTAGASVGASIAVFFVGGMSVGVFGLPLISSAAFIGGALTAGLVYRISTNSFGTSVSSMLLMGIAISALAGSITSVLEFFSDSQTLRRMSLWRMGGLDAATYTQVVLILVSLIILMVFSRRIAPALNVFLLGESQARHLGINVEKIKTQIILVVAAGVGICVAFTGAIAFVGLVVPHIIRLWLGPDHKHLLPLSALGGAILLVNADTLARTLISPTELPIGIITALIGAPVFIALVYQRRGLLR